jgi:hypothetical protein
MILPYILLGGASVDLSSGLNIHSLLRGGMHTISIQVFKVDFNKTI